MGSKEESLELPLAAEAKPGADAASTFPAWPVALPALPIHPPHHPWAQEQVWCAKNTNEMLLGHDFSDFH